MVEERGEQATVAPKGNIRHPDDQVQGWQGRHQGSQKSEHLEYPAGQSGFPESGQHLYSQEFIQQMVSDSTTSNFRRSGSSSTRLSSGALLPGWATNVWAMGPLPMMYAPCPPWVGWYGPWAPPLMHFHLVRWLLCRRWPLQSATSGIGGPQDKKTRQFRMLN
jgi:hypothetical protein